MLKTRICNPVRTESLPVPEKNQKSLFFIEHKTKLNFGDTYFDRSNK